MTVFCTVADVAAFLQVTIAAGNVPAMTAITNASAAIQNYCHQALEEIEDDEYTFDVDERRMKLFLPELPVNEISSIVENVVDLVDGTDFKLGRDGILHRLNAFWYPGVQTVAVIYSHGHATIPDDIKNVCVRAAGRAYQSGLHSAEVDGVAGIQAQSLGDYSVTFGSEQGGGSGDGGTLGVSAAPILLPSEKRILDRYRLRGV